MYTPLQRAMCRMLVLGLWVAKHHDFDEVAEGQEPLKTHGLLKEGICPMAMASAASAGSSEPVITIMRNRRHTGSAFIHGKSSRISTPGKV